MARDSSFSVFTSWRSIVARSPLSPHLTAPSIPPFVSGPYHLRQISVMLIYLNLPSCV